MTMITPAEQWREALPSGNGTIGALVYGSIGTERILFNHNELWYGGNTSDIPDLSAELPVVRKLLFEDYSRTLDFESGEVEVKWRDGETSYSRRLFVSIPDSISVLSLKANQKNAIDGEVTLDIHDLKDALLKNGMLFDPGFTYDLI